MGNLHSCGPLWSNICFFNWDWQQWRGDVLTGRAWASLQFSIPRTNLPQGFQPGFPVRGHFLRKLGFADQSLGEVGSKFWSDQSRPPPFFGPVLLLVFFSVFSCGSFSSGFFLFACGGGGCCCCCCSCSCDCSCSCS